MGVQSTLVNNFAIPSIIRYINTGDESIIFHLSKFLIHIRKVFKPKQFEEILRMTKTMVKHIELDLSTEKLVRADLLCEGETERIQVEISYSKNVGPEKTVLTVEDVKISRPWLNILYNNVLKDNMISKDDITFSFDNDDILNSILK